MDRRLYVYYRVPEATLLATVAAVRTMQATLVAAHPGLQTDLLRRPGLTDGAVTLMETYAGGDAASWSAALQLAAATFPGPRHDEWFEPLG